MFKQIGNKKLGRKHSHRNALVKNQLRSLFKTGVVTTTSPKAKVLKANAESLLSKVRKDTGKLALTRNLRTLLVDPKIINLVTKYANEQSNDVSIVKVGFRPGDMSEMSRVEVLGYKSLVNSGKKKGVKKADAKDKVQKVVKSTESNAQISGKEDKLSSKLAKSLRTKISSVKGKSTVRSGI